MRKSRWKMNDKSSVANYKVSKIKVLYAKINERTIHNQRYFEILYKELSLGNSGAFLFINTMKFEVIPKKLKNFWN